MLALTPQRLRWAVGTVVLIFLLIGAYQILKPFMSPIAWAGILSFVTWPVYRRLRSRLGNRDNLAATLMTTLILFAVVLPVVSASWLLAQELSATVQGFESLLQSPPDPPGWALKLPVIGPRLQQWVTAWKQDPDSLKDLIAQYSGPLRQVALDAASRIGRNLVKVVLALLTAFFFYRYGEELLAQTRAIAHRFTGERTAPWIKIVGGTIRAVVYGLILTAFAQGILAGLGYWLAGVPAPVLLCVATCFLALIPFGAPLIWLPAGLWLIAHQSFLPGLLLLAWCATVVSTIDNVLRPYFISGATRIPYLLVFFGVLGGLGAFGLIGVFIGPTLLSVLLALWRKWASESMSLEDLEKKHEV